MYLDAVLCRHYSGSAVEMIRAVKLDVDTQREDASEYFTVLVMFLADGSHGEYAPTSDVCRQ